MNFTSHLFLFYFLPLVLLSTYAIAPTRVRARNVVLLLTNCLFYGWLDMQLLELLLVSALLNYAVSYRMSRQVNPTERRRWLAGSLVINLACLGVFKYALFFEMSLNALRGRFGFDTLPLIQWVLPVGISFYTFKAISHCVDTYRTGQAPGPLLNYLYIPLGGNRRGTARSYLNLGIVFMLCGLWHGAAWTFVCWGLYHGLLLILERALGRKTLYAALPHSLQIASTFVLVSIGWVFFRSPSLSAALHRLAIMFTGAAARGGAGLLSGQLWTRGPVTIMALCAILTFQPRQGCDWIKDLTWGKIGILVMLFTLALASLFAESVTSFLYVQF